VTAATIPAGLVATCMYQGAYGDMRAVYDDLHRWMQENGLTPSGVAYEHYYNGPNQPEELLLTQIVLPVGKA
jgi:effector-binding domain-containing protein